MKMAAKKCCIRRKKVRGKMRCAAFGPKSSSRCLKPKAAKKTRKRSRK